MIKLLLNYLTLGVIIGPLPSTLVNGTTADATQVMGDFNWIVNQTNAGAAASGVNSDITALTGLTTPLALTEGGTGAITAPAALTNLGAAGLASPVFTGTPTAPTAAAGTNTTQIATTAFVNSSGNNGACDGRLTLTTGVPVTSADVLAATTVFFTPYFGNRVATYNGTNWSVNAFTQVSVAVPSTTVTPFDVFIVDSTLVLETVNWSNDTTRATAIVFQDGVYVKSGDATRRYLGTCRTTGVSGQTEDSEANRFVNNFYNQVERPMRKSFTTARTTTSTSYVEVNSEIRNNWVQGVSDAVKLFITGSANNSNTNNSLNVAIGIDNATALESIGLVTVNNPQAISLASVRTTAAGFHYGTLLGTVQTGTTGTWQGGATSATNAPATVQTIVKG